MSRPLYFITCQWRQDPKVDPEEISDTRTSIAAARKERNRLQKESDEMCDYTSRELFRIFKVQEVE